MRYFLFPTSITSPSFFISKPFPPKPFPRVNLNQAFKILRSSEKFVHEWRNNRWVKELKCCYKADLLLAIVVAEI